MFTKRSPEKADLAIQNGIWLGNYPWTSIDFAHGWWAREELRFSRIINAVGYRIARDVHKPFHEGYEILTAQSQQGMRYPEDMGYYAREGIRRRILGGLGLHMFMHCDGMLSAGFTLENLEDPAIEAKVNLHIDAHNGRNHLPNDYGIHMEENAANDIFRSSDADCWYRDGELWVYRLATAKPSDGFLNYCKTHGINLDFPAVQTVNPFPAFLRAQQPPAGYF